MKMMYKASCPTPWGKHIRAEAETRLLAVIALNKVARLTGNRVDFNNLKLVAKTR